jgi:hypothetical protein
MSEEQEGQVPNNQPNQENSQQPQNPQNPMEQQQPQGYQNFNQFNQNNPFPPYGGGFGGMQIALPNAIIVLVLGILSIVTCCCFYGLIGLVLGIVALILSRKDKQNYLANMSFYTVSSYKNLNAGRVCAIIGLILSGIALLFCILFAIFFGFSALNDQEALKEILRELQ